MADIVQASKPEEEDQEDNSGDDDNDDGIGNAPELYDVEAILEHRADFEDGEVRYQVKWKGYEEESDKTWEPEEAFVYSRDVLEEYWEKVGGKPMPLLSMPTAKKRGRQSPGRTSSPNGGAAKKQRKSDDRSEVDASARGRNTDDDDLPSPAPDEFTDILGPDEWTPPKASSGSWEEPVQTVETVEADDDGRLWVFLSWNLQNEDGRFLRNKVKATTCYRACPQKMLKFFESHLVLPSDKVKYH